MGLGPRGLRPTGVFSAPRGALLIDPPRLSKLFCPTVRVLRSWEALACGGGAGGLRISSNNMRTSIPRWCGAGSVDAPIPGGGRLPPQASPICLVYRPGGRSHGACARSDAKMLRGFPARDPSLFHGTDQPYRPRSRVLGGPLGVARVSCACYPTQARGPAGIPLALSRRQMLCQRQATSQAQEPFRGPTVSQRRAACQRQAAQV
jgi:hypothetical protein